MNKEKRYRDHDPRPTLDQFGPWSKTGFGPFFLSKEKHSEKINTNLTFVLFSHGKYYDSPVLSKFQLKLTQQYKLVVW
jgi:hypothetical protein